MKYLQSRIQKNPLWEIEDYDEWVTRLASASLHKKRA